MATPCLPLQLGPLDNTLGAAYIGNIAAAIFYGITNLQTYVYYERNYDGPLLKSLVCLLWLLDGLHVALISHTMYFYTVTNFSNPIAITQVTWSIMVHIVVTSLSDLLVRGIFAYRVYRLSTGKWWLSGLIVVTSFLVFGLGIAFCIRGFQLHTYRGLKEISWILYMAFGTGVFADCLTAASLCVLLALHKSGIPKSDSIVRVLMMYTINTGALTSLVAIVVLVAYATMPNNFVFIAFYFVLPKMFLNSLLASLNARQKLRGNNATTQLVSIPLSAVSSTASPLSKGSHDVRSGQSFMEIEVQTTVDRRTDSLSDLKTSKRYSRA